MNVLSALINLEIARFSDLGQTARLLNIADGLRCYHSMTHPEISPVGLRFSQPITFVQSVIPPAAYDWLNPSTFREDLVQRPAFRSLKPETHRQFRPPAQGI
jgi:hypothetical protein